MYINYMASYYTKICMIKEHGGNLSKKEHNSVKCLENLFTGVDYWTKLFSFFNGMSFCVNFYERMLLVND